MSAPICLPPGSVETIWVEADAPLDPEAAREAASRCLTSITCTYCQVCELLCPDLCITRDEGGAIQIDLKHCKGCGLCAHYCPKGAIRMEVELQG